MRLSKSFLFAGGAIAAVVLATGICVFVKSRAETQNTSCINNLRPILAVARQNHPDPQQVLALVPLGTTFSNAVAILGTNYQTSETNAHNSFYVDFFSTNLGSFTIQIQSNVEVEALDPWAGVTKSRDTPNSLRLAAPPN